MFNLSVSQLKLFNSSKAKRVWEKCLWIKDDFQNDNYSIWLLVEDFLLNSEHDISNVDNIIQWNIIKDQEKVQEWYNNAKKNTVWLELEVGFVQCKVEWNLLWYNFIWYVDNLTNEWIEDIKTTQYLTNTENKWSENLWSWLTTYQEYELQLWVYMKLLDRDKARIVEVSKHEYKDWKPRNQFIEFHRTEEMDQRMEETRWPKVKEMFELYQRYSSLNLNNQ